MNAPTPDVWVGLHLHEVAPDIWRFQLPLETELNHINVYLIREDTGWCVFDTGIDSKAVRDIWLAALSGPLKEGISRIVVSHHHPDHLGLAAWLQESTGVPVYVRPEELVAARAAGLMDFEAERTTRDFFSRNGMPAADVDLLINKVMRTFYFCAIPRETRTLVHGERIAIGRYVFEILVTGGHSAAQVALYDPLGGIFLAGDQMLEQITSNVGLWPYGDAAPLANYFRSLDEIALQDLRLILPGHYNVYVPRENRAAALRAHHRQRLIRFHERLQGRMTGFELANAVFGPQLDVLNRIFALGETLAHLQWLQQDGAITRHDDEHLSWYERVSSRAGCTLPVHIHCATAAASDARAAARLLEKTCDAAVPGALPRVGAH
jgi:glyoxylase-like metal-dependent hydrolase (beta-lactamase superfamily II)